MMDQLALVLMLLGLLSPCAALVCAVALYVRHRNRVEAHRRVPALAFALAVMACGAIGGYAGLAFGIELACDGPRIPKLCGLWGYFMTGPLGLALAILAVGLALSLVRPVPKPNSN